MLPSTSYNRENYIDQLLIANDAENSSAQQDISQNQNAISLFRNFALFCILYSIAHATVDGVLAFSAAELGSSVGSDGSALLYFFYTFSALLFAKPALRMCGAKRLVLLGLVGLLCYVSSFFIALSGGASEVFLLGASIGGIGAGFLWTGQGSYYSINARAYSSASNRMDSSVALANFASIFASSYLLLETIFKMFATIIYVAKDKNGDWRTVVFGLYVTAAFCAVCCFGLFVRNLSPIVHLNSADIMNVQSIQGRVGGSDGRDRDSDYDGENGLTDHERLRESKQGGTSCSSDDSTIVVNLHPEARLAGSLSSSISIPSTLWQDISAVGRALYRNRRLQLLMPYQVCFGLSAGFVNSYMTAKVVSVYLGDGYIGLMSALATLTAVALSWPYAKIATTINQGKWYVMMAGGGCFLYAGLSVLCLSNAQMSSWPFLVTYFMIYGAARAAWESTNKAIIAEYFSHDDKLKDSAFAAVYFMSGLAGAFGFVFYKFMDRTQLAAINTVAPIIALVCYHFSHMAHIRLEHSGEALPNDEIGESSSYSITAARSVHRLNG